MFNLKNGSVNIGDTKADYISFGKGKKTMVIIPGLSFNRVKGAGTPLAFMYRIFAEEYTVYVIDRKDDVEENCTTESLAEDTVAVMQTLGLCNADIIGISQGGMIAQYIAVYYPQMVNKLVLGVTTASTNKTVEDAIRKWIYLCDNGMYDQMALDMLQKLYSEKYMKKYKALVPLTAKLIAKKDMPRFTKLAKACLNFDITEKLEQIKCPVYVISGAKDMVVGGDAGQKIADVLKCESHVYADLGHAAYEEATDFNKRIIEFLQK